MKEQELTRNILAEEIGAFSKKSAEEFKQATKNWEIMYPELVNNGLPQATEYQIVEAWSKVRGEGSIMLGDGVFYFKNGEIDWERTKQRQLDIQERVLNPKKKGKIRSKRTNYTPPKKKRK